VFPRTYDSVLSLTDKGLANRALYHRSDTEVRGAGASRDGLLTTCDTMRFDENSFRLVWITLLGLFVACALVLLLDRLLAKDGPNSATVPSSNR
jgi:hypothetical protein